MCCNLNVLHLNVLHLNVLHLNVLHLNVLQSVAAPECGLLGDLFDASGGGQRWRRRGSAC
jgi:hypothetical protein